MNRIDQAIEDVTRKVERAEGKHTPGPWKASRRIEQHDDSTLDQPYYSIDLDTANQQPGQRVSGYIARVDGMRGERQAANARLIAAAPELLAAAWNAIEALNTGSDSDYVQMRIKAKGILAAAIAKAESK